VPASRLRPLTYRVGGHGVLLPHLLLQHVVLSLGHGCVRQALALHLVQVLHEPLLMLQLQHLLMTLLLPLLLLQLLLLHHGLCVRERCLVWATGRRVALAGIAPGQRWLSLGVV
jgi:hypothetical protein